MCESEKEATVVCAGRLLWFRQAKTDVVCAWVGCEVRVRRDVVKTASKRVDTTLEVKEAAVISSFTSFTRQVLAVPQEVSKRVRVGTKCCAFSEIRMIRLPLCKRIQNKLPLPKSLNL